MARLDCASSTENAVPRWTPATRAPASMSVKVLYIMSRRTSGSSETAIELGLSRSARAVTPAAWAIRSLPFSHTTS